MTQDKTAQVPNRTASLTAGLNWLRIGLAWLVFLVAFPFLEVQEPSLETFAGGALIGLPIVVFGFLAASRCRSVPERKGSQRGMLIIFALLVGIGIGAMNLGANVALASVDSSIGALLKEHFAEPFTWTRLASVAVVEEFTCRLFVMSVAGWAVSQITNRTRTVFLAALIVSTLLFALGHLFGRPMPAQPEFAALYAFGVVAKSAIGGLAMGWIYWRWGIVYAVLGHFVANGLHMVLEPVWFS